MTSGTDLRQYRRKHEVSVTALARLLGVSRQTVHTTEGMPQVAPEKAERYAAAVRELATRENE